MNEPGTMQTGPLGSTIHEEGTYSQQPEEPAATTGRRHESDRTESWIHHA